MSSTSDTATGASLDQWGTLVGQSRYDGWTDEEFRAAIRTRIDINLGQGEATRLIRVITILLDGLAVWYRQVGQAAYRLVYFTDTPPDASWLAYIRDVLFELTPAGVEFSVIEGPATDVFRFDIGPGLDTGKLSKYVVHPDF